MGFVVFPTIVQEVSLRICGHGHAAALQLQVEVEVTGHVRQIDRIEQLGLIRTAVDENFCNERCEN